MYLGSTNSVHHDSFEVYGWFFASFLYLCQFLTLLALPQAVFNFLGFTVYNPFPHVVPSPTQKSPLLVPYICFRVVTRGDYPELVRNNVNRNVNTCLDGGLINFVVEVVTDKSIGLSPTDRVREVVVPADYRTRSGAMFKARALQYCLEDSVNVLSDDDWVVHLDEETLLTSSSIVNYFLTLCDTVRVAEDMGKIQFQLRALHMPLLGWKGSFVVSNLGAERKVTYDNGPDSSVAEDTYFGILAASQGHSFDFVNGEMWEKSPFNIPDFIKQRKRWLQGLLLVAHSSKIPLKFDII
nr:EOG090X07AI [Ilyocryptus agilis]